MSRAPAGIGMAPPLPGAFIREEILDELATLTKNTVRMPNSTATFDKLANPTPFQDRALQLLSLRATL